MTEYQAVTPGGVVAVKVTGQQTDSKPSLTAELRICIGSATGDGWVAYLAVPLETEPGSYTRSPWTARCRSLP